MKEALSWILACCLAFASMAYGIYHQMHPDCSTPSQAAAHRVYRTIGGRRMAVWVRAGDVHNETTYGTAYDKTCPGTPSVPDMR